MSLASAGGHISVVQYLLGVGADIHEKDDDGEYYIDMIIYRDISKIKSRYLKRGR